jgi:FMN-dependent NADH-azoreductase
MSNVLFVTSSLFGENSKSRIVAAEFLDAWRQSHPVAHVTVRDTSTIPHLDAAVLTAGAISPERRTPEQREAASLSDRLIAEVEAANIIVIAAPMYNFSISSPLKAWIDHVARAGRTFRYNTNGPEGLLKGKRVFAAGSRGGFYAGGVSNGIDFHEPYLRSMLRFLGLDDVTFIHAEGQNVSAKAAADGMAQASNTIANLMRTTARAAA